MEVLEWKGEDLSLKKDGSIERIQIEAGEGYSTPNDGAFVEGKLCLCIINRKWLWII